MSTEQQKSFIAAIRCDDAGMTLFGQWLESSWFNNTLANQQNRLTTRHRYSRLGKMVTARKARPQTRTKSQDMFVYFQSHGDCYTLQILSEIGHGKYIGKDRDGCLAALTSADNATSFHLLNASDSIVTLDQLPSRQASIALKVRNAGTVNRQYRSNPHVYSYADKSGDSVKFNLTILERNVSQPTGNTPYVVWIEPLRSDENDD